MYNKIIKLSKKKIIYIVFSLALLAGVVLVVRFFISTAVLSLSVSPDGSTVTLYSEQQIINVTKPKTRIPKSTYRITVKKDGYIPQEKEITLSANSEISFSLREKSEDSLFKSILIEDPQAKSIGSPVFTDSGGFLGIDPKNGNLIYYRSGDKKTIYQGAVNSFHQTNNLVVISDLHQKTIFIVNLDNNTSRKIALENADAVSSACIMEDMDTLYSIGNYDSTTKSSDIIVSSISKNREELLEKTKAQDIVCISKDIIILREIVDFADSDVIHIYSPSDGFLPEKIIGNDFSVSPQKDRLAVTSSSKTTVYMFETKTKREYKTKDSDFTSWINNDEVLIAKNDRVGISLALININESEDPIFEAIPNTEEITIRSIIGFYNNKIIIETTKKEVVEISVQ